MKTRNRSRLSVCLALASAAWLVPLPAASATSAGEISYTPDGFVAAASLKKGIYAVGTLKSPVDVARSVQDATGVAIKSIQSARR